MPQNCANWATPLAKSWRTALITCFATNAFAADEFPPLRPIVASDAILVVSPHPDDESLCCGGVIAAARRAGASVAIVWVTNGDGFKWDAMVVEKKLRPRAGAYQELAKQRAAEARAAAAVYPVKPENLFFLGYPDRGVLSLLFDYYYPSTPWRSKFTGANSVVYEDAVAPGTEYDGEDLERDFASVVERVKPTLVLAPSPQDTHPDHRGTGILTMRIMAARKELENVRYWIVHGGKRWPEPRGYHPRVPQTVAPRGLGMKWEQFALDDEALDKKLRAVQSHRSQTKVMGRVMQSYVRTIELYSRTPVPPRSACLHDQPCEFEEGALIEESSL
jgi:LmbE family N-acetylglucosaminyl deacetylase